MPEPTPPTRYEKAILKFAVAVKTTAIEAAALADSGASEEVLKTERDDVMKWARERLLEDLGANGRVEAYSDAIARLADLLGDVARELRAGD